MMTVIELGGSGAGEKSIGYRVLCKGASEIVLSRYLFVEKENIYEPGQNEPNNFRCAFILGRDGKPEPFTEEKHHELRSVVRRMAEDGLRTICIAYKDYIYASQARQACETEVAINSSEGDSATVVDWNDEAAVSTGMVALAICGIQDPVRDEVPLAIQKCKRAGITVRMVTGDNVNTARAIAQQCGILGPGDDYLVLEGREVGRFKSPGHRHVQTRVTQSHASVQRTHS
jgi:magnesium-transporting ATPase (P-type)